MGGCQPSSVTVQPSVVWPIWNAMKSPGRDSATPITEREARVVGVQVAFHVERIPR